MKSVAKTKHSTNGKTAIAKRKPASAALIPALKASTLKEVLWETLIDLRSNDLPANRADAIAAQAREILRTVKTQLHVTNAAKRPVPREIVDFVEQ